MSLSGEQLKALARQGAAQRYQELQDELAALTATFPELARGGGGKRRASRRQIGELAAAVDERCATQGSIGADDPLLGRATGGGRRRWSAARPRVVAASRLRKPPRSRRIRANGDSTRLEHGVPCPIRSASRHSSMLPEQAAMSGDFAAAARLLGEGRPRAGSRAGARPSRSRQHPEQSRRGARAQRSARRGRARVPGAPTRSPRGRGRPTIRWSRRARRTFGSSAKPTGARWTCRRRR